MKTTQFSIILQRLSEMTPEEKLQTAFKQSEFIMKLYKEGRRHDKRNNLGEEARYNKAVKRNCRD